MPLSLQLHTLFPYTTLFRSRVYTFVLRRGVRFPNGDELTSRDVKYSLERATDPRLAGPRSEEHTSELQSPCNLVCRLLLEKKKLHLQLTDHNKISNDDRDAA